MVPFSQDPIQELSGKDFFFPLLEQYLHIDIPKREQKGRKHYSVGSQQLMGKIRVQKKDSPKPLSLESTQKVDLDISYPYKIQAKLSFQKSLASYCFCDKIPSIKEVSTHYE